MKKLISTLCVLAMMMSMTVASAAKVSNRNIVEWRLISRTDSEAVLQVHINTNKTIAAYAMYWDFSDAFAKGATNVSIKPNAYNDNRVNFVTSNGKAFAVIADVDIYGVSTNTPLATVTVSGITEEFTIRLQGDSPRTRTHIAGYDGNNFTSEFSFPNAVVQRFTPITGIKLSSKEVKLGIGNTTILSPSITPSNATNKKLKWISLNPRVASVDNNGKVTAKSSGDAYIMATTEDGKCSNRVHISVESKYSSPYYDVAYPFNQSAVTNEKIELEIYQRVYGDEQGIKEFKADKDKGTNGVCMGFASSSLMFYYNAKDINNYGASNICNIQSPQSNLKNLIRYVYLTQNIGSYMWVRFTNNIWHNHIMGKLDNKSKQMEDLVRNVRTNKPAYIAIGNKDYGHALIAYDVEADTTNSNGQRCSKIYIYDCNRPKADDIYIEAYKKSDGSYTGEWSYPTSIYPTPFNSGQSKSRIAYIPYDVLLGCAQRGDFHLMSADENINNVTMIQDSEVLSLSNNKEEQILINDGIFEAHEIEEALYYDEYYSTNKSNKFKLPNEEYTITSSNELNCVTTNLYTNSDAFDITTANDSTISFDIRDCETETSDGNNYVKIDNKTTASDYSVNYMPFASVYGYDYDSITISGNCDGIINITEKQGDLYVTGDDKYEISATVGNQTITSVADNLSKNQTYCVKIDNSDESPSIQMLCDGIAITEEITLPAREKTFQPTYDVEPGEYSEGKILTLTPANDMINLYYTLDGTIPTKETGINYSEPININKSMNIKVLATQYGCEDSDILELDYTLPTLLAPYANVSSGELEKVQVVNLYHEEDVNIYYTLDGSDPYTSGILYNTPITVYEDATLKIYAEKNGVISEQNVYEYVVSHKYPLYLNNGIINQEDNVVTGENLAELSTIKMVVNKTISENVSAKFIVASYDSDGKIITISSSDCLLDSDENIVEIITQTAENAKSLKIFAWDSFKNNKPLCETLEIK